MLDCFLFSSEAELDLLEIRLRYLCNTVNLFCIIESNCSFSGNPKSYILQENWKRFEQWHTQIKYFQIEQEPSNFTFNKVDYYTPTDGAFLMETECRNSLMYANDLISDDSLVLLSDVDEFPDVHILKDMIYSKHTYPVQEYPIALQQDFYAYYINFLNTKGVNVIWKGTIVCKGSQWLNTTPQQLRDNRNHYCSVEKAGYHFSWVGGLEAIKHKIRSFAHTEFNREHILDDQAILSAIKDGRDVLQRPNVSYQLQSMDVFPDDLRTILLDYPHLIK